MMALAWLVACFYVERRAGQHGIDTGTISTFLLVCLIGFIIGARIFYLIANYPNWVGDIWNAIFSRYGFVFYGGFLGCVVLGTTLLKCRALPILLIWDIVAPAFALSLAICRIGCFLAGDDYGIVTNLPWAVTFTDPNSVAPKGIPLHPFQLYLSFTAFSIFLVLHHYLKKKRFDGQVISLFMILYSATVFPLEYLRGQYRGGWWIFTTSQIFSLFVLPIGVLFYLYRARNITRL